jgi:predicted phosphodiesterase
MRALIVADIHSNLEAFEGVIADAETRGGFDQIWSAGDLVGYGPSPGQCIQLMRRYDAKAVAGNHDLASVGEMSPEAFNDRALAALIWTTTQLSDDEAEYLRGLPRRLELDGFTVVHGSPRHPEWEYVHTPETAAANFAHFDTPICLIGHTHIAIMCRSNGGGAVFEKFQLGVPSVLTGDSFIVNPGAVGQPRDGDPRAGYAVFDSDDQTITHHRVEYDVTTTQRKMSDRGLPSHLVERLARGI